MCPCGKRLVLKTQIGSLDVEIYKPREHWNVFRNWVQQSKWEAVCWLGIGALAQTTLWTTFQTFASAYMTLDSQNLQLNSCQWEKCLLPQKPQCQPWPMLWKQFQLKLLWVLPLWTWSCLYSDKESSWELWKLCQVVGQRAKLGNWRKTPRQKVLFKPKNTPEH